MVRMPLRPVWQIAIALLLGAAGVAAQGPPKALDVLAGVGQSYSAVTTFHGEGTMQMETSSGGMRQTLQIGLVLDLKMPRAMRVEMNSAVSKSLLISDGQNTWLYMPTLNIYSKIEAPANSTGQNAQTKPYDVLAKYRNLASRVRQAQIVRTETLTVNGKPANCWVVHVDFEPTQATGPLTNRLNVQVQSSVGTLWVEEANNWVVREDADTRMLVSGSPGEITQSLTFEKISMNPPISDALFTFSPPSGAHELDLSKILSNSAPTQ